MLAQFFMNVTELWSDVNNLWIVTYARQSADRARQFVDHAEGAYSGTCCRHVFSVPVEA